LSYVNIKIVAKILCFETAVGNSEIIDVCGIDGKLNSFVLFRYFAKRFIFFLNKKIFNLSLRDF
jgi:hypothetical protein